MLQMLKTTRQLSSLSFITGHFIAGVLVSRLFCSDSPRTHRGWRALDFYSFLTAIPAPDESVQCLDHFALRSLSLLVALGLLRSLFQENFQLGMWLADTTLCQRYPASRLLPTKNWARKGTRSRPLSDSLTGKLCSEVPHQPGHNGPRAALQARRLLSQSSFLVSPHRY